MWPVGVGLGVGAVIAGILAAPMVHWLRLRRVDVRSHGEVVGLSRLPPTDQLVYRMATSHEVTAEQRVRAAFKADPDATAAAVVDLVGEHMQHVVDDLRDSSR